MIGDHDPFADSAPLIILQTHSGENLKVDMIQCFTKLVKHWIISYLRKNARPQAHAHVNSMAT